MLTKIRNFCKTREKDLVLIIVIICVAFISFGLGRLSKIEGNKSPVTIESLGAGIGNLGLESPVLGPEMTQDEDFPSNQGGLLVGSKNGAKYHYPWCSGALRIKEENKIWFNSAEEALQAGYTPASNCKGL